MRHKCCVVGCSSKFSDGITLHRFPVNSELKKLWSVLSGNPPDYGISHSRAHVCTKHFKDTQYLDFPHKKRLVQGSIPKTNLPVTILIVEQEQPYEECFSDPATTPGVVVSGDGAFPQQLNFSSPHAAIASDQPNEDDLIVSPVENSCFTDPGTTPCVVMSEDGATPQQLSIQQRSTPMDYSIQVASLKESVGISDDSTNALSSCENVRKRCVQRTLFPDAHTSKKRKLLHEKKLDLKALGLLKTDLTPRRRKLGEIARAFRTGYIRKYAEAVGLKDKLKQIGEQIKLILGDKLSPLAFQIVAGELKNREKAGRSRRWSSQQKALAVALYKLAPTSYAAIAKMMCLPSKSTILGHLRKVPFNVGLNKSISLCLKQKAKKMSDSDKLCVLCFDEVAVAPNLQLNTSHDEVDGYVDFGTEERIADVADHALVFMALGAIAKWKMPLAYYFCMGTTKAEILRKLITEVIDFLSAAGFTVIATVCDQGATNRGAIGRLVNEGSTAKQQEYFIHRGEKIFTIYDPPHLLKCTRNLLIAHPLRLSKNKVVNWKYIEEFYKQDRGSLRMAQKLTDNHIFPQGRSKMKVKFASQVFSHHVYAGMKSRVLMKKMTNNAVWTADFVRDMDRLFDSFNGKTMKPKNHKLYRTCIFETSKHKELWEEMTKKIQSWKFINKEAAEGQKETYVSRPPTINNWIISIKAMQGVWDMVREKHGIKFLSTRNFNQDPLENHFSIIRRHGGANTMPTVVQFSAAMKSTLVKLLANVKASNSNCGADQREILLDLEVFFDCRDDADSFESEVREEIVTSMAETPRTSKPRHVRRPDSTAVADEVDWERFVTERSEELFREWDECGGDEATVLPEGIDRLSTAYVGGYIVKRLLPDTNQCSKCCEVLSTDIFTPDHTFISFKEYKETTLCLRYPSKDVIDSIAAIQEIFERDQPAKLLDQKYHQRNVVKNLVAVVEEEVDFSWLKCQMHHLKTSFSKIIIQILLKFWCKRYNRELKNKWKKPRATV